MYYRTREQKVVIPGITYKIYVGEGAAQMVYTGEASYILGIVKFVQTQQPETQFEVKQVTEKLITIRTLKARAEGLHPKD